MQLVGKSRILGHCFGDGYIHLRKHYFIYTNKSEALLKFVVAEVAKEFNSNSFCTRTSVGGTPQVQFPVSVGRSLMELGAPCGAKTRQATKIPDWILKGDVQIRSEFLSAICDDEAEVRTDAGSKQITIKSVKTQTLSTELDDYLNQIRSMFLSLGIPCSPPRPDRTYVRSNELKIAKRIWITGRANFTTFACKIALIQPEKQARLSVLLQSG